MAEDICHRLHGFHGTPWRSRDVEDETTSDGSRQPAGEAAQRAHGARGLGQAGGLALEDGAGRLRGDIGRREPRASRGHDESREPGRKLNESGGHRGHPVGYNAPIDDSKPVLDEDAGQLITGSVLAGAQRWLTLRR